MAVENFPVVVEHKPNKAIVGMLEYLLDAAKAGKILSIAGVALMVAGDVATFVSAHPTVALLGGLEILKQEAYVRHRQGPPPPTKTS